MACKCTVSFVSLGSFVVTQVATLFSGLQYKDVLAETANKVLILFLKSTKPTKFKEKEQAPNIVRPSLTGHQR